MNNMEKLNHLASITDEMLAGLQTDETMRLRIVRAAREQAKPRRRNMKRYAPAFAFAAAAIVCVGVASVRLGEINPGVTPMTIGEIAAGEAVQGGTMMLADLGDGASVRMARSIGGGSLFAESGAEIPVVTVKGNVYRMLSTPQDIGRSMLQEMGSIQITTEQPSLASDADAEKGLSNVAQENAAIYSVKGVSTSTAIAAEVNGSVRLFQRVSYAGRGPAGDSLRDTFSVSGKIKTVELDGVGTLEGGAADDVIDVLLSCATLKSADAGSARQYLTVTLDNGLRLQLGVSGDTLSGCGSWSCPEFFEAFEQAMK